MATAEPHDVSGRVLASRDAGVFVRRPPALAIQPRRPPGHRARPGEDHLLQQLPRRGSGGQVCYVRVAMATGGVRSTCFCGLRDELLGPIQGRPDLSDERVIQFTWSLDATAPPELARAALHSNVFRSDPHVGPALTDGDYQVRESVAVDAARPVLFPVEGPALAVELCEEEAEETT